MNTSIILTLLLIIPYVFGRTIRPTQQNVRKLFDQFKRRYKKVYSNGTDEQNRFSIFVRNLALAEKLQKYERETAKYGVTKFSDLTEEEFAAMFMTTRFDKFARGLKTTKRMRLGLPNKRLDWRQKGAVTPVEDQGRCGSCWAFSVVGNIESQYYLSGRNLTVLSKQQLVDCDRLDNGCDGGYPPQTYSEVMRLGGLVSDADYPYEARRRPCRLNKSQIVANINLALILPEDEEYQAKYLGARGPLATVLNAKPLQFYQSGIYSPPALLCSNRDLNHGVLTVGYGQDGRFPYWIVKNSWGSDWGEKGYFRIRRGRGVCGIEKIVTTAVI